MDDWLLGMTTVEEQSYLHQYARSIYSGEGEIIDLGCWLGSTTISLARGLSENIRHKTSRKKIHAYDRFQWEDYMESCVQGSNIEGRYKRGDDFLDEFMTRIKPYLHYVEVHHGNLRRAVWNSGAIELLLIDAMKSWRLVNAILQTFIPSLLVGKSQVIQQDFAHYYTSWLHLIHYRMRDHFKLICTIPNSSGVVFQYIKPIPEELLQVRYDFSTFSDREVEEAFNYSMHLVSNPFTLANIASAHVMWHMHLNDPEKARFHLDRYLSMDLPFSGDLKIVGDLLETVSGSGKAT